MAIGKTEWQCVQCGYVLGHVLGGEFYPCVPGEQMHTSGPNLAVKCPNCNFIKTFYTADPVVRALYQLVNAVSSVAARSMVEQLGKVVNEKTNTE